MPGDIRNHLTKDKIYESIRKCLEMLIQGIEEGFLEISGEGQHTYVCCMLSVDQDNLRIVVCNSQVRAFHGNPQIGCSIPKLYEMKGAKYE